MDPRKLSYDERLKKEGICVYCGKESNTREHVPPKVFLDKPYPPQLPVVEACEQCNNSYSKDEQYFAAFIECVVQGTTQPNRLFRNNIVDILNISENLRQRIEQSSFIDNNGNIQWKPEKDRIENIIRKLAIGHVAYELYPHEDKPTSIKYSPLELLNDSQKIMFINKMSNSTSGWSEIGTRTFERKAKQFFSSSKNKWITIQKDRYKYYIDDQNGLSVRIVIRGYLACEVIWN